MNEGALAPLCSDWLKLDKHCSPLLSHCVKGNKNLYQKIGIYGPEPNFNYINKRDEI